MRRRTTPIGKLDYREFPIPEDTGRCRSTGPDGLRCAFDQGHGLECGAIDITLRMPVRWARPGQAA